MISPLGLEDGIVSAQTVSPKGPADVRFGSLADMAAPFMHVRFTPNSGHQAAECNVR
jgi:hypothetical protein